VRVGGKRQHRCQGPDRTPQTDIVDLFFVELYLSAAEPLPDQLGLGKGVAGDFEADKWAEVWNPGATLPHDVVRLSQAELGVPVRYLPPGRLHDVYLQFLAWHDVNSIDGQGNSPASFVTFWRHWKAKWHTCLKFRKVSQHSTCQVCFDLKRAIEAARGDLAAKIEVSKELRNHLKAQYQDRTVYWNLRWASRQHMDVLVVIIDSMDKTKFAMPRYQFGEKPKGLERLIRPRMTCTGVMAHGWFTGVYLSDESVNHGADYSMDLLVRAVSKVWRMCREQNRPFPRHLVLQCDNTPAQFKNKLTMLMMAYLVSRFKFLSTNVMFLRVGHTHEDIGQNLSFCWLRCTSAVWV